MRVPFPTAPFSAPFSAAPFSAAPRRVRLLVGALAVVLLCALTFTGGYFTHQLGTPGNDSAEAGFARDMASHHAQAVEMALIAYPKVTRAEVRTMAYDMATSQEYQIGVMDTWLQQWHLSPTSDRPRMAWMPNGAKELSADGLMPGMATKAELDKLRSATGKDADILFLQLMLHHHLGGIHMIDGLLAKSSNAEVRRSAEGMRANQSSDIGAMQKLLEDLGASAR